MLCDDAAVDEGEAEDLPSPSQRHPDSALTCLAVPALYALWNRVPQGCSWVSSGLHARRGRSWSVLPPACVAPPFPLLRSQPVEAVVPQDHPSIVYNTRYYGGARRECGSGFPVHARPMTPHVLLSPQFAITGATTSSSPAPATPRRPSTWTRCMHAWARVQSLRCMHALNLFSLPTALPLQMFASAPLKPEDVKEIPAPPLMPHRGY
jgi:hypothetical protein